MIRTRLAIALVSTLAVAALPISTTDAQGRGRGYGRFQRLSGTYELDRTRSETPEQIANRAVRNLRGQTRVALYQNVVARAQSPATLVLDVNGRNVNIMSTNASRVTFVADGVARTEPGPSGLSVTTVARVQAGRLNVSMKGERGNEYALTIEPTPEGLRLVRHLDNSYDGSTIVVQSEYRRVADPRWNVTTTGNSMYVPVPRVRRGAAMLPSGTVLSATLDRGLNTNTVNEGDRITLTVTAPSSYEGSVLEGRVGRIAGQDKDNIAVTFDSIRLDDGRVGTFAGVIETVRMPDGRTVAVDKSGVVRGDDAGSTNELKSGAIGAALGAILGAVVSGKEGAVVGGVAGGAGAIILDKSRQNRTLPAGTRVTVSTSSTGYVRRQ